MLAGRLILTDRSRVDDREAWGEGDASPGGPPRDHDVAPDLAAVAEMTDLGPAFADLRGEAKITVLRDGKEISVTLTMPERP